MCVGANCVRCVMVRPIVPCCFRVRVRVLAMCGPAPVGLAVEEAGGPSDG